MKDEFNTNLADSQATEVSPIVPEHFDIEKYAAYTAERNERCSNFWNAPEGVLVYRRMRVAEVFAGGSADKYQSLNHQLGALEASMDFEADIPNFLEPWYGLGTVASAFGLDYIWEKSLAPAVNGKYASTADLLKAPFISVADTPIGRHTLEMTEHFLEKTHGRIPMSYCDVQSPLNILSNIIDSSQFYMDFILDPESMHKAMERAADLLIEFTQKQKDLIGNALVKPGHGFSSSQVFEGIGMSDDSITMLSPDLYMDFAVPSMTKVGDRFGGTAFHSCGNWSDKRKEIASIRNLRMVDGAFSYATDPDANPTKGFADTFANTNVILNVRIVGDCSVIEEKVRELWKPGIKLIVVTYCSTPAEQTKAYKRIHEICQ